MFVWVGGDIKCYVRVMCVCMRMYVRVCMRACACMHVCVCRVRITSYVVCGVYVIYVWVWGGA